VYMCSNTVSLINPYFVELGVSDRLRSGTKFLRGNGWVLEQTFNESAANAVKQSAFMRAFENNSYGAYAAENRYLNDNLTFIERPIGDNRYLATIRYCEKEYGIREYSEQGVIYADTRIDPSCETRISVTTEDHRTNYVILSRNAFFISMLRNYYEKGCFRFKNLEAQRAVMKLISY